MEKSLNRQGLGTLIALAVEFTLGMAINLFVAFPEDASPHSLWIFTVHNPLVLAHLIVGTLIVLGVIPMVIRAFRQHVTSWQLPALAGMVCVFAAWAAGDMFVTAQAEALSYLMSLAFLLAIFSFGWGLYRSKGFTSLK